MIFPLSAGKLLLVGGLVSCQCCGAAEGYELAIKYGWEDSLQPDLDTKTVFLSEQVGWSCGASGTYLAWLPGSDGIALDDQSVNGFERVDARVDLALTNGLWTSSVNIECFAGWYSPRGGSGPATLSVTYKGVTASKTIAPGSQPDCAATPVGTITVYANGTFNLV